MGRQSRNKRSISEQGNDPIYALAKEFSSKSLVPILDAASVSPKAAKFSPSYAVLYHSLTQRRLDGKNAAVASDLRSIVTGLRSEQPQIESLQDYVPPDARNQVLIRWGDDIYRIPPGFIERPVSMFNECFDLAGVIDPVLVPALGYGLLDVGEVVLRRLDAVTRALAPVWDGSEIVDEPSPEIDQDEVDAVRALPSLKEIAQSCAEPKRAMKVVQKYTQSRGIFSLDLASPTASFGSCLAAKFDGEVFPLPAGFLVESIKAISSELSAAAAKINPRSEREYEKYCRGRVGGLLQGSGRVIAGPIKFGTKKSIHSLLLVNERQFIALDIVPALAREGLEESLSQSEGMLSHIRPGLEVRFSNRKFIIPENAEICRVQLIASPHEGFLFTGDSLILAVRDLEWIVRTSQEDPEDLWYFLRDLRDLIGIDGVFSWDLIDQWEVWREEKTFYRGALPVTHMIFAPHHSVAEWERAAEAASVEESLYRLGLPALYYWPIVEMEENGGTNLGDLETGNFVHVLSLPVPVAVARTDQSSPENLHSILWSVSSGISWKLDHIAENFSDLAVRSGLDSLIVNFTYQVDRSGPPLSLQDFELNRLEIFWNSNLGQALERNSFEVEILCGEMISHALGLEFRDQFIEAWSAAPPGVRADGYTVQQAVPKLPAPLRTHDALKGDLLRDLGKHMLDAGIEPGVFEGSRATQVESGVIFPWLIARLHEIFSLLDPEELLSFSLIQLECANNFSSMFERKIAWSSGFPERRRKESDTSEQRQEINIKIRAISLVIEELLARGSEGSGAVDEVTWKEILAVAELGVNSCLRSDSLHQRLTRNFLEVTDLMEVRFMESHDTTDVNFYEYMKVRNSYSLPEPVPISVNVQHEVVEETEEAQSVVASLPHISSIDEGMKSTLHFGIDALVGVLNVGRQWPVSPSKPLALVSPSAIVEKCLELTVGASREEYSAALEWLTLRGSDLTSQQIAHWESERRDYRIATRPYIRSGDGVWVLPWTAEASLKLFTNYLDDGRLPRPHKSLPSQLSLVLNQYRQRQNRELEKECVAALEGRGFNVLPSLTEKKAKKLGVPKLSGEIDALCIDEVRSRIWVIEAKDPFVGYSSYQIRRLADDFLKEGKYVDKLLRKSSDIRSSADQLAEVLKIPGSSREWTVVELMVTRRPELAAFSVSPKVAFCMAGLIDSVVDSDSLPELGFIHKANKD